MTIDDIHAGGTKYTSNRIAFSIFIGGLRLQSNLLLDPQLMRGAGVSGQNMFFNHVMHHVIPNTYDIQYLANIGGSFALGIEDVGAFTVMHMNRRVVTLKGYPTDLQGRKIVDANVRADAFLALFNGFLGQMAEQTLLADAS